MKYEIKNLKLIITAEKEDKWNGQTIAHAVEGQILKCGKIQHKGKSMILNLHIADKPLLQKAIQEWQSKIIEEKQKIKEGQKVEEQKIENGERNIPLHYVDGEFLQGYAVYDHAASLLISIGMAKYVESWGNIVDPGMIEELGENFTYLQAKEYAKPIVEKKERRKKEAAIEEKGKIETAKNQAKKLGKRIKITSWATDCDGTQKEECSTDIISRWVTPEGKIECERVHTH